MSRSRLRVLHAPTNIAGIAGLLARAERDLGYDARAVEYISRRAAFETDASLHLEGRGPLARGVAVSRFAAAALRRYDVFHLYFGNTLFPWPYPDLPVLRALGKRIIYHFCGCDVRNRARNLATQALSGCSECVSLVCLGRRRPPLRFADAVFVSTPDLLADVPGAVLMPGPIDLDPLAPGPAAHGPGLGGRPAAHLARADRPRDQGHALRAGGRRAAARGGLPRGAAGA